jgi:hypothetical protein
LVGDVGFEGLGFEGSARGKVTERRHGCFDCRLLIAIISTM